MRAVEFYGARTAGAVPLVMAQVLNPLVAFSERVGVPPPRLLARARDGDATLPLIHAGRLWEDVARESGDEGLGLRVGAASRFEEVLPGRHASGSPTIGKGLAAAAGAVGRYCTGEQMRITTVGADACVQRRHTDALHRGRRQVNDFALRIVMDIVRRGAGPQWRPAELHLEGPPPSHAEELAALATKSVRFGAAAETLVFPRSVLALRLPPSADLSFTPSASLLDLDLVDSIRETIRILLEVGELTLPSVAEAAGISVRSLQRRLAASNVSFTRIVEEARFEVAFALLREPEARIVDVSAELGYTDAANFTRAFRRWTGVPPQDFRKAIQVDRGVGVR